MNRDDLAIEWQLLQIQFDSYEKFSLAIKSVSFIFFSTALFLNAITLYVMAALLVLWLQDGIWKTFQQRIESRLLQLEAFILTDNEGAAFQFNRQFLESRQSGLSLIKEYGLNALRPTTAYLHSTLTLIVLLNLTLS